MRLNLPREIEQMAERRAAEGGFRDVADYIAQLVAADARDTANEVLEDALLEGLEGKGDDWDLETMRAECRNSLAAARKGVA